MLDSEDCYRILAARDARFDGLFFTGVTSTGIYCRCVCTAKLPKAANCQFFENAAGAESRGFRPCLICRPELAPGRSGFDPGRMKARRAARMIEAGVLENLNMEQLASTLEFSDRQLRRVMLEEVGVTPIQYALTCRLLAAKRLLTDTKLPVGEVALASGFKSVRRLNTVFQERYGLSPTALRVRKEQPDRSTTISRISYRPPFDWDHHLQFLVHRRIQGVETMENGAYARTVAFGPVSGVVKVSHEANHNRLKVEISEGLTPYLPKIIARIKRVFDLDANPTLINEALGDLAANPGIRLPGAFDGFEAAVRAVLGQQVSVKFATTLAGRVAERFGTPLETGVVGLSHIFPGAERLAESNRDEIAQLGVIGSRANAILAIAREVATGRIQLNSFADYEKTRAALLSLPGVGPWTAEYICMRALSFPDAFPSQDLGVFKALGTRDPKVAVELAEKYRPWRAYAVLHLWHALSKEK